MRVRMSETHFREGRAAQWPKAWAGGTRKKGEIFCLGTQSVIFIRGPDP